MVVNFRLTKPINTYKHHYTVKGNIATTEVTLPPYYCNKMIHAFLVQITQKITQEWAFFLNIGTLCYICVQSALKACIILLVGKVALVNGMLFHLQDVYVVHNLCVSCIFIGLDKQNFHQS